nr:MAG TPA: protein of unknown function (DUF3846) [Caudoviricetes sp.]
MKTIKITTDNKISIIDVNFDDHKDIQKAIGGYIEPVHTKTLFNYFKAPIYMLVDEEGLIKNLPVNVVASHFYGFKDHGCVIAGDAIFALAIGENLIGFGDRDSEQWMEKLLKDFSGLEKDGEK